MVGYAVSGFVDGFFKGREFKNAQEDRKLDRERQKRLDAMDEEMHNLRLREFGLREQEFGLRRRSADAEFSEYERGLARRAQEEEFHRRLAETMPLGVPGAAQPGIDPGAFPIGQPQGQPAIVAPVAPARPAAPATPRLGFGAMPATVAPQAAVDLPPEGLPITNVQPVQGTLPADAANNMPPLLVQNEDGSLTATRSPRNADEKAALVAAARSGALSMPREKIVDQMRVDAQAVPGGLGVKIRQPTEVNPNSSGFVQDLQGIARQGSIDGSVSKIGSSITSGRDGGLASSGAARTLSSIADYFTKTPEAAQATAAQREARAQAADWYRSTQARELFTSNPELLEIAASDPANFYQQVQSGRLGAGASAQPNAPATIAPARVGDAPPAVKAAESAAATSPAPAASANATKQAVGQVALSFGLKPGEKITERQAQSAADAALEWYNETAVPEMMRYYVSTGQLDKAQAYAEIMESRAGQNAMRLRAAAAFKAVNGDIDGWGRDILESFKSYGYVDPTYDIDEEATGMIRDSAGNFAGARLVFKDRRTGDTVEKLFQSENELFNYGLLMTDPATMVETMMSNANKPEAQSAITDKDIMESAVKIFEAGMGQITMDQAIAQAAAAAQSARGAMTGGLGTLGASQAIPVDPRISGVGDTGFYRAP
ncbi:MAG: hypothetical protein MUF47_08580 [Porphyrobacter sp.]|nr:hypothetical protein [Porphyrobacter sp.]